MQTAKSGKIAPEKEVSRQNKRDTIKELETENNGRLIKVKDLYDLGYPLLHVWLKVISRYGNTDRVMLIFECEDGIRVKFFTESHQYSIFIDSGRGYLGAGVQTRKPRPGETWTRGNDLPDGDYTYTTWKSILLAIIKYELKNHNI